MENDDFYRDCLIERLEKFAQIHGVPTEGVVSIRLRPLQKDGSKAYVAWPSHEKAIELAGVSRVPHATTFFGAEYLPRIQGISDRARGHTLDSSRRRARMDWARVGHHRGGRANDQRYKVAGKSPYG